LSFGRAQRPQSPLGDALSTLWACSRLPSLAGIAAEAEGLQVAEVVRTALVFGDDVVHLQGPLVLGLLSNSLLGSIRSGHGRG
jgi:hypothetical protein